MEDRPFYEAGLRFECKKDCSRCCGGSPGYVFMDEDEQKAIEDHLGLDHPQFLEEYTKQVGERISLRDLEEDNWNCIMLKDGKCSVYEVRPLQCRTFPFWAQNIFTRREWEETAQECPGIGTGRLYSEEEIESIAMGDETIDSVK